MGRLSRSDRGVSLAGLPVWHCFKGIIMRGKTAFRLVIVIAGFWIMFRYFPPL